MIRGAVTVALAAGVLLIPAASHAADDPTTILNRIVTTFAPPRIHAGAYELGVAGSVVREGGTTVSLNLRGARFFDLRGTRFALEADAGWTHVRELDGVDFLGSVQWLPWPDARMLPFAGVIGGVRQEWLGSFREARVPIGVTLGVRVLAGHSAAFRAEYRFLQITGDVVGNHGEHRLQFGMSMLLGNHPR